MRGTKLSEQELDVIIGWRRNRLRRAGFDRPLADALACDQRIDLHAVLELIDRGCPSELAARIVAPLEDDGDRR